MTYAVTTSASGDARKATALAMSSGRPVRPDRARRGNPGRLHIVSAEAALAHPDLPGQRRKGQVVGQAPRHPTVQWAEAVLCALKRQDGAELRLPSGALEKHDQVARHRKGQRTPHILFD